MIKVLKNACMVEGDLFTPEGIGIAARGTADVIFGLRPRLAVGPKMDVVQSEGSPS